MTKATSQMTTQVKIKWFRELSDSDKERAYFALKAVEKHLIKGYLDFNGSLYDCLGAYAELIEACWRRVEEKPEDDDAYELPIRLFVEALEDFSFFNWIKEELEHVSHGDPVKWYVLIPVGHGDDGFKFPVNCCVFKGKLVKLLMEELGKTWEKRTINWSMLLAAKGFKTPRQFCIDEALPLNKFNRLIRKNWRFLEGKCGSTIIDFPGADPIVLLSPEAQQYLLAQYTSKGGRDWFREQAITRGAVKAMGDDPLFN
jgi:hypothetical protein